MPGYMAVDVDRHRHARDVRREPFDVDLQRCRAALQPHRPDVELVDLFGGIPVSSWRYCSFSFTVQRPDNPSSHKHRRRRPSRAMAFRHGTASLSGNPGRLRQPSAGSHFDARAVLGARSPSPHIRSRPDRLPRFPRVDHRRSVGQAYSSAQTLDR